MCSILVHSETCVLLARSDQVGRLSRNHKYLTYRGHGLSGIRLIVGTWFYLQEKNPFRSISLLRFFFILKCIVSFRFFLETIINSHTNKPATLSDCLRFKENEKREVARRIDDASENMQSARSCISSEAMRRNLKNLLPMQV